MRPGDWNRYWNRSREGRFTRISWSKRRILDRLDPYLKPAARVLDAGCGSGWFSARFLERECRVSALDFSAEALDIAREATGGKAASYLQEDLLDPRFGERHAGMQDLIFSDGLFEHFSRSDQDRILANMIGALAPGGVVATFVPNALSPWTLIRPFYMPGIEEKPFRLDALVDLHRPLEIIDQGGLNVLPIRFSPDRTLGSRFGMLLYVFGRKGGGGG